MASFKKSYIWSLSKEEIQSRVNTCYTMSDVLVEFGFSKTSGTMTRIFKELFKKYAIDTSHFDPKHYKDKIKKIPLRDILVKNSTYTNMSCLKKRLVREGLMEYVCEECGNRGIWNNKKLSLQLEHKDGDHYNNELSNLCFLCPNCHSQTGTYGSKNSKNFHKLQKQFKNANRIISSKCPDKFVLEQLLKENSYSEIGRQHSVSSNTVKKWAKKYGLYRPVFNTMPEKYVLDDQLQHFSVAELAEHYGVCVGTIHYWISRRGCVVKKLAVKCIELDCIFDTKADAARSVFPELNTHYAANKIGACCVSGDSYRGYHWVSLN